MRRTIQNYVIASSATAVPMEIGAIGKFGKGKGKWDSHKGNNKWDSGKSYAPPKWESGSDYGSKKGGEKGLGKEAKGPKGKTSPKGKGWGGGGSESEKFGGFCGRWGK